MNDYHASSTPTLSEEHDDQTLSMDIEQVIDQIGTRYIADLRMLTTELSRFYNAQLAAKEQHIAQLNSRLTELELDRDALAARLRDRERANAQHIADLRAWSEELNRRMTLVAANVELDEPPASRNEP